MTSDVSIKATMTAQTKRCTSCGQEKSFDCFGPKRRSNKIGQQSRCKPCIAEITLKRHTDNKQVINARRRAFYLSRHPSRPRRESLTRTRAYSVWSSMKSRCTNPKQENYRYYGARGITVCERWEEFSAFFEDMGHPPDGYSIDRIDPCGNYEPSNCRWADAITQANNKRPKQRKET